MQLLYTRAFRSDQVVNRTDIDSCGLFGNAFGFSPAEKLNSLVQDLARKKKRPQCDHVAAKEQRETKN
jgi:hypothetical protein